MDNHGFVYRGRRIDGGWSIYGRKAYVPTFDDDDLHGWIPLPPQENENE